MRRPRGCGPAGGEGAKFWLQLLTELKNRGGEFEEKWSKPDSAISRLWRNAWSEFLPFLDYDVVPRASIVRGRWRSLMRRRPGVNGRRRGISKAVDAVCRRVHADPDAAIRVIASGGAAIASKGSHYHP